MPTIDTLTVRIDADLDGLRRGLGRSQKAIDRFVAQTEGSLDRVGKGVSSIGEKSAPAALDAVGAQFGRLDEVMVRPAEEAAFAIQGSFSRAARSVGFTFARMAEDGRLNLEGLRDIALSVARDILVSFQQLAGVPTLGQALAGALAGAIPGSSGGIQTPPFIPAFQRPGFVPPGIRQLGGPVQPGRSFLVGEQGPELFVPKVSGEIVPNDNLRRGVGQTFVFNIDARGAEAGVEQRILRALRATENRAVVRAVGATAALQARGAL